MQKLRRCACWLQLWQALRVALCGQRPATRDGHVDDEDQQVNVQHRGIADANKKDSNMKRRSFAKPWMLR
jgi:hypothetical protein